MVDLGDRFGEESGQGWVEDEALRFGKMGRKGMKVDGFVSDAFGGDGRLGGCFGPCNFASKTPTSVKGFPDADEDFNQPGLTGAVCWVDRSVVLLKDCPVMGETSKI